MRRADGRRPTAGHSLSRIARNVTARNSTRRAPFHGFAFFQTTFRNRAIKLAEALMQRADMQKRPDQLKKPLRRNAQVKTTPPLLNPQDLLHELEQMADDLEHLIQRINRTNAGTTRTVHDSQSPPRVLICQRR